MSPSDSWVLWIAAVAQVLLATRVTSMHSGGRSDDAAIGIVSPKHLKAAAIVAQPTDYLLLPGGHEVIVGPSAERTKRYAPYYAQHYARSNEKYSVYSNLRQVAAHHVKSPDGYYGNVHGRPAKQRYNFQPGLPYYPKKQGDSNSGESKGFNPLGPKQAGQGKGGGVRGVSSEDSVESTRSLEDDDDNSGGDDDSRESFVPDYSVPDTRGGRGGGRKGRNRSDEDSEDRGRSSSTEARGGGSSNSRESRTSKNKGKRKKQGASSGQRYSKKQPKKGSKGRGRGENSDENSSSAEQPKRKPQSASRQRRPKDSEEDSGEQLAYYGAPSKGKAKKSNKDSSGSEEGSRYQKQSRNSESEEQNYYSARSSESGSFEDSREAPASLRKKQQKQQSDSDEAAAPSYGRKKKPKKAPSAYRPPSKQQSRNKNSDSQEDSDEGRSASYGPPRQSKKQDKSSEEAPSGYYGPPKKAKKQEESSEEAPSGYYGPPKKSKKQQESSEEAPSGYYGPPKKSKKQEKSSEEAPSSYYGPPRIGKQDSNEDQSGQDSDEKPSKKKKTKLVYLLPAPSGEDGSDEARPKPGRKQQQQQSKSGYGRTSDDQASSSGEAKPKKKYYLNKPRENPVGSTYVAPIRYAQPQSPGSDERKSRYVPDYSVPHVSEEQKSGNRPSYGVPRKVSEEAYTVYSYKTPIKQGKPVSIQSDEVTDGRDDDRIFQKLDAQQDDDEFHLRSIIKSGNPGSTLAQSGTLPPYFRSSELEAAEPQRETSYGYALSENSAPPQRKQTVEVNRPRPTGARQGKSYQPLRPYYRQTRKINADQKEAPRQPKSYEVRPYSREITIKTSVQPDDGQQEDPSTDDEGIPDVGVDLRIANDDSINVDTVDVEVPADDQQSAVTEETNSDATAADDNNKSKLEPSPEVQAALENFPASGQFSVSMFKFGDDAVQNQQNQEQS